MRNLLSANFLRLRKSLLFWGVLAVGAAFAAFRLYSMQSDWVNYGIQASLDEAAFTYAQLIGLTAAVFVSLFLGTEYSDGAIRNKVAVGCPRVGIYLAGFSVASAAAFLSLAAYWIVVLAVGIPLFGSLQMGIGAALTLLLETLLMTAAFCAIFTFLSMNCSNKAANAVVCILLFFAMLVASTYLLAMLDAPETYTGFELGASGERVWQEFPNEHYVSGTRRVVYEFLYDLLPTGQATQYSIQAVTHPLRPPLCSLGITAVFTAAGAALFRRKDLK